MKLNVNVSYFGSVYFNISLLVISGRKKIKAKTYHSTLFATFIIGTKKA